MSETHDYYVGDGAYIETFMGGKFYAEAPTFDINDIAGALSKAPRFAGHASIQYTVAQHSLMVSTLVWHRGGNKNEQLDGLLHDATEAYLADIPAPFKQFLPDYRKLDAAWTSAMRKQFGLAPSKPQIVQWADWIALFIEANEFMRHKGADYVDPFNLRTVALGKEFDDYRTLVIEEDWVRIADRFRDRYVYLTR